MKEGKSFALFKINVTKKTEPFWVAFGIAAVIISNIGMIIAFSNCFESDSSLLSVFYVLSLIIAIPCDILGIVMLGQSSGKKANDKFEDEENVRGIIAAMSYHFCHDTPEVCQKRWEAMRKTCYPPYIPVIIQSLPALEPMERIAQEKEKAKKEVSDG